MKGSRVWKEWLDGFADHCRLGLADTVEQSLLCYAKESALQGAAEALRTRPSDLNSLHVERCQL